MKRNLASLPLTIDPPKDKKDINACGVIKGDDKYILLFYDAEKADVFRQMKRWAENDELSFNWFDAAMLALKVREGA